LGQKQTFRNVRPVFPQKRTSLSAIAMSALCQSRHSALRQRLVLFDHLVGAAKKRERNCETQCFGSLLVDHQLKLSRLLDW
jgi:hypothetical protein